MKRHTRVKRALGRLIELGRRDGWGNRTRSHERRGDDISKGTRADLRVISSAILVATLDAALRRQAEHAMAFCDGVP